MGLLKQKTKGEYMVLTKCNVIEIANDHNFNVEGDFIVFSYDSQTTEEAMSKTKSNVLYDVCHSDLSYESDEDRENEVNGWIVTDVSIEIKALCKLSLVEVKAALDIFNV